MAQLSSNITALGCAQAISCLEKGSLRLHVATDITHVYSMKRK